MSIKFELEPNQLQVVVNHLAKGTWAEVDEVIKSIETQYLQQTQPDTPPEQIPLNG